MRLIPAEPRHIPLIRKVAEQTWPATYSSILSSDQLDYMMDMMYSRRALERNFDEGVSFVLLAEEEDIIGFAGFEHGYRGENRTHLHKIYVLPQAQGKNAGKKLLSFVEQSAVSCGSGAVTLNVNRFNKALGFYERLGYSIFETVDIEIGKGYLMEDFVMRKPL